MRKCAVGAVATAACRADDGDATTQHAAMRCAALRACSCSVRLIGICEIETRRAREAAAAETCVPPVRTARQSGQPASRRSRKSRQSRQPAGIPQYYCIISTAPAAGCRGGAATMATTSQHTAASEPANQQGAAVLQTQHDIGATVAALQERAARSTMQITKRSLATLSQAKLRSRGWRRNVRRSLWLAGDARVELVL